MKVEEQLREISALDPSIKKLEDLTKMPNYTEFYARVQQGFLEERPKKIYATCEQNTRHNIVPGVIRTRC